MADRELSQRAKIDSTVSRVHNSGVDFIAIAKKMGFTDGHENLTKQGRLIARAMNDFAIELASGTGSDVRQTLQWRYKLTNGQLTIAVDAITQAIKDKPEQHSIGRGMFL